METTVQTEQPFLNIDGAQIEKERRNLSSAHLLFLASRSLTLFYSAVLEFQNDKFDLVLSDCVGHNSHVL